MRRTQVLDHSVGRPAEYNTFGEYAGRVFLCSRAINRPDCRAARRALEPYMALHGVYWRAVALAGLISTASFQGADGQAAQTSGVWRTMPDGSHGKSWSFTGSDGSVSSFAERCWRNGRVFDCLEASVIGTLITAKRYHKIKLDGAAPRLGDDKPQGGYVCSRAGDVISEAVFRDSYSTPLVSHQIDLAAWTARIDDAAPSWRRPSPGNWSRDYVEGYIRQNGVRPDLMYLDCLSVTQSVREGSADSINTTSISYDGMRGEPLSMLNDERP